MAIARAAYQWDDTALVSVEVETAEGFPDAVAEVTAGCRRLLRESVVDINGLPLIDVDGDEAE